MSQGLRSIGAPALEHRRSLTALALLLLLSYAYFVGAPAWNQNSRLALTRAIVEHGTVAIDRYHETTGDKSYRDGHFYADKAPGTSLLAVVPYAVFYAVRRATGGELPDVRVRSLDPDEVAAGREIEPSERKPGDRLVYNHAHRFALYLCTLFAIGIPSVAAAGAVYLLARRHGGGHRPAATVALTYALATPAFPYSTALYGHQLCGSLLIVAFAICVLLPRESGARRRRAALVAGALLGMAGMTEYPALVAVAALAGFAMVRHGWRFAFWVVLGGTPFAIALALYHTAAFGSPLATGYDFVYLEQFAEGMRVRYGIGMPDPRVALAITFGAYRGLFYASPVLLLAAWGLVADLRDPMRRLVAATATLVVAFFVLLNAGYYMWDGGAAIGPRHVVPALAFLALGLVRAHAAVPWALGVLAVVSALQMLLAAAAAPEASQHGNPLWGYALERVLGHTPGPGVRATNLGVLLGLPGLASLLPLLPLWLWAWRSIAETRPQR